MILFFCSNDSRVLAVQTGKKPDPKNIEALEWLFSGAKLTDRQSIEGIFVGPRKEMITPWSTSAVEICQSMNIDGIERIEEFFPVSGTDAQHDRMLQRIYVNLEQDIFNVDRKPEPVLEINDLDEYNRTEGLALNPEEIEYLKNLSRKLGRPLTDGEVFGFSQVNSEHCRHKIFNGTFIIDGKEMESSLFKMIKKTTQENPNRIVSAYKDNCAFIQGPKIRMFHPASGSKPDYFITKEEETVISLKAETHNFPTTVEPFNGAATGSGGEIRDRIAGGKGSFPIAGTAVYMTSYTRFDEPGRDWEKTPERKWLYQSPQDILTKASNGASDFGNKFGQAVICGSVLTLEHTEKDRKFGYDKVIMMAGGVGYAKKRDSIKESPEAGDKVVLLGGDNYRIGMGGGAVSSVATGEYANAIELNAIQRSNPEMQKRAYNAIRAIAESDRNTIISVHDHGAGGHLNCLSELVEETGGDIDISKLPVGDPTLSAKEIIGNESQERMGLVMKAEDTDELMKIAERERAPMYVIGEATGRGNFTLRNSRNGDTPIDLALSDMFGSTPKTIMEDREVKEEYAPLAYDRKAADRYLRQVLQMEAVACKDWLTNKVDRSVTGLIACQQCTGEIQLPLNDLGVTAIGYMDNRGIVTSIGHAPAVAMANAEAGSRMAISEALTNAVWAPIEEGIRGISLSANWMWPCRNEGENARLYKAVKAASDFAIGLGINIPTGKDSMSMTQKYPDGEKVLSPGTLIISTVAETKDVRKTVHPVLAKEKASAVYCIPFTKEKLELGGSAFAQTINMIGDRTPDIRDTEYFRQCFGAVQELVDKGLILAGHDISAGGIVTALLEMNFANACGGLDVDLRWTGESDDIKSLFAENPAVLVQIADDRFAEAEAILRKSGVEFHRTAAWKESRTLDVKTMSGDYSWNIDEMRDIWYRTSYLFDRRQSGERLAEERYRNYKSQVLEYRFPENFTGKAFAGRKEEAVAAIIREKGSNGDREMAWALSLAGFKVKDVHMTDLISGRENLEDVNMIVFVGGFSNADTLGSAKGWAGAFLYNEKAKEALDRFYARKDTMSLGICNGCQLMTELGYITPERRDASPKMKHNDSHKFESGFTSVNIEKSPSIMLRTLEGSRLGIWIAHGEGKFSFPEPLDNYNVAVRYSYHGYPANPNGSPEGIAGITSNDGRHLVMMPHPERCLRPWNWAFYDRNRMNDEVTPWIEMFNNAYRWCVENRQK